MSAHGENRFAVNLPESGSNVCRVADTHGRMERMRMSYETTKSAHCTLCSTLGGY